MLGTEKPRQGCWPLSQGSRKTSNCSGPSSWGQLPGAGLEARIMTNSLIYLKLYGDKKGRASLKPLPKLEGTGEDRSSEDHMDSMQAGMTSPLKTQ